MNIPFGKLVNDCVSFRERRIKFQLSFPKPDAGTSACNNQKKE